MCTFILAIFITLVGLKLVWTDDLQIVNEYYLGHVYKIHPLLVAKEGKKKSLIMPNNLDPNGVPTLNSNEELYLYCCGYNNRIATSAVEKIDPATTSPSSVQLSNPKTFIKFKRGNIFKDLYKKAFCLSPMLATHNLPGEKCGFKNAGTVLEAAFKIGTFMKLYSICFDERLMSPIYTMHVLHGSKLLFPENKETWAIPNRYLAKVYKNISVASPYYPHIQQRIFLKIFGAEQGQIYLNIRNANGTLYCPAPLTPPGDFYFLPHKTATNVFENTLPVFNAILVNDIHIIEELGRLLAYQVESKKLLVITGAYLKLHLPITPEEYRSINLDTDEINKRSYRPFPKFIYKIYYDAELKKGIAFVTANNPYTKFKTTYFPCRHLGVDFIHIDYFSTDGILRNTVYCKIGDLIRKVKGIPHLDVSNGHLVLNIYDNTLPKQRQLPSGYRVLAQ